MEHVSKTLNAIFLTHRIKATLGYNIAYLLIFLALLNEHAQINEYYIEILILFTAAFLLKTQASIADVLHDYKVDKNNPAKQQLANAVDYIGRDNLLTLTIIQITISLILWGVLSVGTNSTTLLFIGGVSIVLGFVYSYPPRIKEQGITNHIVTSGVDVAVGIAPIIVLVSSQILPITFAVLTLVFLYSFGYHIAHQAADTYYDRQTGISTFTQQIGIDNSLLLMVVFYSTATLIALQYHLHFSTILLVLIALKTIQLFTVFSGKSEKQKTDELTRKFNIAVTATLLNMSVAASIYVFHTPTHV